MNIWEFFNENWFLAFIIVCSIYYMFKIIFFILPNRVLRHANIRKHGYPPAHCDADGDFKEEASDDDNI